MEPELDVNGWRRLTYAEARDLGEWLDKVGERTLEEEAEWQPEVWTVHGIRVSLMNGFFDVGKYRYSTDLVGSVEHKEFVTCSIAMLLAEQGVLVATGAEDGRS